MCVIRWVCAREMETKLNTYVFIFEAKVGLVSPLLKLLTSSSVLPCMEGFFNLFDF